MGVLEGLKVIEVGGIGPIPFAGMMLADMGADVISISRKGAPGALGKEDIAIRGKKIISLDLKNKEDIQVVSELITHADILIEGFRPGVMERLGLSPEYCYGLNEGLIYGRMTGWGQHGKLAYVAGHDINYIALSGALHAVGDGQDKAPTIPLNLVGDYGGGAMFLLTGILAALYERNRSGKGQVIDAAMTDGSGLLMTVFHSLHAHGLWEHKRGVNLLDGGAHFYNVYRTSDNKYVSIAPMEPKFYAQFLEIVGLDEQDLPYQMDTQHWPVLKQIFQSKIQQKTQQEWCELLEGTDVCFAPVLSFEEAPYHSHAISRNSFINIDGRNQPAPAPRYSRTPSMINNTQKIDNQQDINHLINQWRSNSEA